LFEPFGQKIPFHRQLANLGMEIVDLSFVVHSGLVGTVGKYRTQTVLRLTLPCGYLVWMYLVPGCNFLNGFVAT